MSPIAASSFMGACFSCSGLIAPVLQVTSQQTVTSAGRCGSQYLWQTVACSGMGVLLGGGVQMHITAGLLKLCCAPASAGTLGCVTQRRARKSNGQSFLGTYLYLIASAAKYTRQ